jgi:hypothetical protein
MEFNTVEQISVQFKTLEDFALAVKFYAPEMSHLFNYRLFTIDL